MIAGLLRAGAAELERAGRSRLCVELMRGAADDADGGAIVALLFADDPATPGSVPELRLLAALHNLVPRGAAPDLARHYPSAGGDAPASGAGRSRSAPSPSTRRSCARASAAPCRPTSPGAASRSTAGCSTTPERAAIRGAIDNAARGPLAWLTLEPAPTRGDAATSSCAATSTRRATRTRPDA